MLNNRPVIGVTIDIEGERLSLRHWYITAIERAGGYPVLISPTTAIDHSGFIDGLLIPGGDDIDPAFYGESPHHSCTLVSPLRTELEFSLIRAIMRLNRPILGICHGMQAINVALGGSLFQDIESIMKSSVNHKSPHTIVADGDGPLPSGIHMVNSTHHQAVKALADGLAPIARAEDSVVEAFYMKGYPFLLGVQWHPERLPEDPLSIAIFDKFVSEARHAV